MPPSHTLLVELMLENDTYGYWQYGHISTSSHTSDGDILTFLKAATIKIVCNKVATYGHNN
jgi:hypothetical protein